MSLLERELAVAIRAAEEAGRVLSEYAGRPLAVREKGKDQPVTDADLRANERIHSILAEAFPDDGWLSEETADSKDRLARERVWVVDPLDGTKEFVQGIPEYCVSIGLVEGGLPRLGVCHNPARGEWFTGVVGRGARYNGKPSRVTDVRDLGRARILASRSEEARGEWDPFKDKLHVVLTGSVAYKLALISAGLGDGTFSLTPKNEWDVCGGVALVLAAGGRVTDPEGGVLRFNREDTKLPGLVAANEALHRALLELVRGTGFGR
ncbi:MAG: hypothetical protein KatS3mg076_1198 [Candidatus Binatia bacterium]|nr:MAG: hypothetical protein KatS3mg076_1198 [Candidatus Binatia bacterium]